MFGWATSGYNNQYPYMTSTKDTSYHVGYTSLDSYDWGDYNAIYNPHTNTTDAPGTWRTLTKDEWEYLMNTRSTSSGIRYAKASVNGVNGLIIVPDNWNTSVYTLQSTNRSNANYTTNTINYTDWIKMENAGCVFLPAAGSRDGTSVSSVGSVGVYWSAIGDVSQSYSASVSAYDYLFKVSGAVVSKCGRHNGVSVRLVRNVK